jgi:hypothetical protein
MSGSESEPEPKPPMVPHSPFDITSPGALLASPDEVLPRTHEPRPRDLTDLAPAAPKESVPAAETHVAPAPIGPAADSSTTLRDADADAASERRPKVVLRAGERLLSATGSGVVIRRERRVAPLPSKE